MDVPFYEDEIMPIDSSSENTMYDKSAMKLDLGNSVRCQNPFDNSILTSPDLNLLKLASPELEKLILNSASLVTPTPQGLKNSANVNLTVTEQQELYARGFLEALQKLHQEQGPPGATVAPNAFTQSQTTATVGVPSRSVIFTQAQNPIMSTSAMSIPPQMLVNSSASMNTVQSFPSNTLSTISTEALPLESVNNVSVTSQIFPQFQTTGTTLNAPSHLNAATNYIFSNHNRLGDIKLEESLQVVPGTPPLPPIDLELQEAVKSERKKQRNRMAASKCRRRKLEKEADLEKKVGELKEINSDLQNEALELRKQICQLKEQVMTHINGGCKVYLSSQT